MSKRRVVVTGMGIVCPIGLNCHQSWQSLISGQSGIRPITAFDTSPFSTTIAGEVHGFDPQAYMKKKEARKIDPFIQYAIAASEQAIEDASLNFSMLDLTRCGVLIGSGIGGLGTIANNNEALLKGGVKKVSPFFVPGGIINMASGKISMQYGLKGPNLSIATACTSGLHSIGIAAKMIAYGEADLMVSGGAEAAVTPIGIAGFSAARALSKRNDTPEAASRPWDKDRDGFVLADGAGVLIIEEMQHAINRGATVLAELIGFGMSSDAYHMTSPPEDGAGAKLAMENALKSAAIETSQIDYINAHGTSTIAGDIAEATAIKSLYRDQPCTVPVSSSKSMTGHLIGAAGAVESIFSILAIKHNMMPPTINIDHQDDQCDLDFIAEGVGRAKSINVTMCNSFGFGGTNASLIFRSV